MKKFFQGQLSSLTETDSPHLTSKVLRWITEHLTAVILAVLVLVMAIYAWPSSFSQKMGIPNFENVESVFGEYGSDGSDAPSRFIEFRFNNLNIVSAEKGESFLAIADRYTYQRSFWQLSKTTSSSYAYIRIMVSLPDTMRVVFLYEDGTMFYNRSRYDIGLFNKDGQRLFKELSQFLKETFPE